MLSLERFRWDKNRKTLSAEISDLNIQVFKTIEIRSHKTGVVEKFSLSETIMFDGDLVCWTFLPINKNLPIQKVVIFND